MVGMAVVCVGRGEALGGESGAREWKGQYRQSSGRVFRDRIKAETEYMHSSYRFDFYVMIGTMAVEVR